LHSGIFAEWFVVTICQRTGTNGFFVKMKIIPSLCGEKLPCGAIDCLFCVNALRKPLFDGIKQRLSRFSNCADLGKSP
jgi:hypothetical protein